MSLDVFEMPSNWVSGVVAHRSGFLSVKANLAYRDRDPATGLVQAFELSLPIRDPNAKGFPRRPEAEELQRLQAAVIVRMTRTRAAVVTAFVTTSWESRHHLWMQTDDIQAALDALRGLGEECGLNDVSAGHEVDPTWKRYERNAAAAVAGAQDATLSYALKTQGVDLERPRLIEFVLVFPSFEVADRVAAVLRTLGFKCDAPIGTQEDSWTLEAKMILAPSLFELAQVRVTLMSVCADFGGSYDGWGTPVTGASTRKRGWHRQV